MLVSRRALELGALLIAAALVAVMTYLLLGARGLVLANGQPLFGDFIAFWSAGRAALDGAAVEVHNVDTIARYHQLAAPGSAYVAPWNSPPPFLLIVSALALLPYPVAAIAFLMASGAIYFCAARLVLPDARALIFAVTLPAALYHLGTVQAALLIAGVNALALVWLDRRPLAAGALVGLLVIKPHLAVLWPLLLALSGRWRAFAAAAVSTIAFVVLAGVVFGFDAYGRFLENLGASQGMISDQRITTPAYASLYASALGFGAPHIVALVLQAASALAAIGVAVSIFLRSDRAAQGAALCAATLLISPYLFFYDFTLLALGAALLGVPRDRFELVAAVLAWSAGLSLALGYLAPLPLCPVAAWVVLIAAMRRAGSVGARFAPAPQP
ncbi:glycosyltransferase family 87 protein [Terricaulis sp.]|uniref:glycosyltransferase family 87 protein n=1 Tax=Terricaulis sp. TaxID=2768686 RepID=UPI002AC706CF|nr:glycosyltransferase family 87 protein [Terricaulis sp.]MDZ4693443.1 glycosyltransferase family 87 protein [Terricaulis sp.]